MLVTAFYADALARIENLARARAVRRGAGAAHRLICARATARLRKLARMQILVLGGTRFVGPPPRRGRARRRARGHGLQPRAHAAALGRRRAAHRRSRARRPGVAARPRAGTPASTSTAICRSTCGPRPSCWPSASARYAFISTASVYVIPGRPPIDETASAPRRSRLHEVDAVAPELYGPLKVACEQEVERAFPGRALILRPGIVAGPYDPDQPLHVVGRARRARRRGARTRSRRTRPCSSWTGATSRQFSARAAGHGTRRGSSTSVGLAVVVRRAARRLQAGHRQRRDADLGERASSCSPRASSRSTSCRCGSPTSPTTVPSTRSRTPARARPGCSSGRSRRRRATPGSGSAPCARATCRRPSPAGSSRAGLAPEREAELIELFTGRSSANRLALRHALVWEKAPWMPSGASVAASITSTGACSSSPSSASCSAPSATPAPGRTCCRQRDPTVACRAEPCCARTSPASPEMPSLRRTPAMPPRSC